MSIISKRFSGEFTFRKQLHEPFWKHVNRHGFAYTIILLYSRILFHRVRYRACLRQTPIVLRPANMRKPLAEDNTMLIPRL
jgi:hypothetical protein